MDFTVGDDNALAANIEDHATALTQLESSAQELHKSLNSMLDYQTHHRLVNITFAQPSIIHLHKTNKFNFNFSARPKVANVLKN